MLIVFDIDGTLANLDHRLHYVREKPKNWKAFELGIADDTLIEPMREILWSLAEAGNTIIFASGRNEHSHEATIQWMEDHKIWGYGGTADKMYMRASGDYRNDAIVKKEILEQIIKDYKKKPDMVFDDRPRVVNMWRENGIFVLDVNQSGEDF